MGVESVSVAEALSHAGTLEISCHSPTEYCCQLWNPWKAKDIQAIEAIQRTFTYKMTERYIIIYIWKITQPMVPNIDGTMGHKIKTRKHPRHGTLCVIQYPTNRNPAQSPSRKCNTCIWASVVQLVAKISQRHRKC